MKTLLLLLAAAVCAGCSTPPVEVQDSARATARWVDALDADLKEFKEAADVVDQLLLDRQKTVRKNIVVQREALTNIAGVAKEAGDARQTSTFASLQAMAAARQKSDEDNRQQLAVIDAEFASLLKPLPSASSSFSKFKADLGALSRPLPDDVQWKEFAALKKKLDEDTKANRDKLKQASKGPDLPPSVTAGN